MTILEAIRARHSVRNYTSKPLPDDVVKALNDSIAEINAAAGLHFQLVLNEPHAFSGPMSYGTFSGVRNYIVAAGGKDTLSAEKIGYYGERLVLEAQTLGLNSCWVGLTYRKTKNAFELKEGEKVHCLIAVGYGEDKHKTHKIKSVSQVSNASDRTPDWFRKGVEAALLAPTAINQQKFHFEYTQAEPSDKPTVVAKKGFSLAGYTATDLGIAKYHFEVGAGKENFEWGE